MALLSTPSRGARPWLIASLVVVGVLGRASPARAVCDATSCAAMNSATICNTSTWSCQFIMYAGDICIPSVYMLPPVGTACETDNNPCTTDTCGGTAGATNGDGVCHHTAVANGTSCGTNKSCTGGVCGCNGGLAPCGATCITAGTCCDNSSCNNGRICSGPGGTCSCPTACCADSDCPNDPTNHRSGLCTAGGCGYKCDTSYKPCGTTCIQNSQCCQNGDCTTPLNGCYKSPGTCTGNACTYADNDGASCNADDNACTPNDTCKQGSCAADLAHTVKCVQRECHSMPSCNTTSGNCIDTVLPASTACGNNGCTAAGTCNATGVCSSPTKDCSSLTTDCQAGICDPALPMATNCTTANVLNGTTCTSADKCLLTTSCQGGTCVGTPKTCVPSGPCSLSACNPATGNCEETTASPGTSCDTTTSCTQNAVCDNAGACKGNTVPDDTPCDNTSCAIAAACVSGQCLCLDRPDFGGGGPADAPDLAATTTGGKHGCTCSLGAAQPPSGVALLLCFALLWTFRRSRRAVR